MSYNLVYLILNFTAVFNKSEVIEMIIRTNPYFTEEFAEVIRREFKSYSPAEVLKEYNERLINYFRNPKTLKAEEAPKPGYHLEYIGQGLFIIKY